MNPSIKETAELLRLKLLLGLVTVPEVIQWADEVITAEDAPDWELIEVSLAREIQITEMMKLLTEIRGDCVRVQVYRRLFKTWLTNLSEDPAQGALIARQLYMMTSELPENEFGSEAFSLDDSFDLVEFGYGTHAEAVQRLRDYLEKHASA